MPRLLALLLLALLTLLGGDLPGAADAVADRAVAVAAELAPVDDCCPPAPGPPPPQGDCCDVDSGRCCAAGILALAPVPPAAMASRPAQAEGQGQRPLAGLHPRPTGPPPTPPPIA